MNLAVKRTFALLLAAGLIIAAMAFIPGTAKAESLVTVVDVGNGAYRISEDGSVTMSFTVNNNNTAGYIDVTGFTCTGSNVLSSIAAISTTQIPAGGSQTFTITGTASTSDAGTFTEYIQMSYNGYSCNGGVSGMFVDLYYNHFTAPTAEPSTGVPKIGLSSKDRNGMIVQAASGNAGERVTVKVPLVCLEGPVSNITLAPKLSADLEAFPFVIEDLDYTLKYPSNIGTNNILEFNYDFKFSDKAKSGAKKVEFEVSYVNKNMGRETVTLAVFVNVINGYVEPSASPIVTTQIAPKLIVDSYSIAPEKVYAGETFDVTLNFKNTSTKEDVENIQITIDNEVGKVLPANNASNTVFIEKIKKGETYSCNFKLQSAPDTEAKSYVMKMKVAFTGTESQSEFTSEETFSVPILQKIRLKFDDPVVYDEAWQNQSVAMQLALYNLGKAPIYNCMVDIEGEGLEMEETYFGGTVNVGSTLRADFSIIPSVAGDIAAEVIVTYEDVYGEQMEKRLPVNIFVNEEYVPEEPVYDPSMDVPVETGPSIPTWVWYAAGGVVAVVVVIIIISALKRKRAKELEDV